MLCGALTGHFVPTACPVFLREQETSLKALLDRGEKLEDLAAQSNDLSMESKVSPGIDCAMLSFLIPDPILGALMLFNALLQECRSCGASTAQLRALRLEVREFVPSL